MTTVDTAQMSRSGDWHMSKVKYPYDLLNNNMTIPCAGPEPQAETDTIAMSSEQSPHAKAALEYPHIWAGGSDALTLAKPKAARSKVRAYTTASDSVETLASGSMKAMSRVLR